MKDKPLVTTCLNLTKTEYNRLKKESQEKSISVSEVLRRIIDEHFEKKDKK